MLARLPSTKTSGCGQYCSWPKVDIADVNNDHASSTYTIAGQRGSGAVQLNGAAAHLVNLDDLVIMAYAQVPESQVRSVTPSVVFVDA